MTYSIEATSKTPALIIYLLDCSASMGELLDGKPRIEHVNEAIEKVFTRMVQRSTKGEVISPRYRLAVIAYSDQPHDVLGGVKTIQDLMKSGTPQLNTMQFTDTAAAFIYARDLLQRELPKLAGHPAPMICHLTDGEYNGADPEPIARDIMNMTTDDGNVLIENIFVSSGLTRQAITDIETWPGISDASDLTSDYAKKLFNMSSPLPDSYAEMIHKEDYQLKSGARMLIPGANKDLIELAFAMSGATPTA
ncbi:MAG: VWA domain-containing protein [Acidobacteriota bacterium]|nr:VWA domain-containing protein [Acidobacteriota bacterium]